MPIINGIAGLEFNRDRNLLIWGISFFVLIVVWQLINRDIKLVRLLDKAIIIEYYSKKKPTATIQHADIRVVKIFHGDKKSRETTRYHIFLDGSYFEYLSEYTVPLKDFIDYCYRYNIPVEHTDTEKENKQPTTTE